MTDATRNNPASHRPRELVLRMMPMPADANANGDIFGGWIMAQVDIAGSVLPAASRAAASPRWR